MDDNEQRTPVIWLRQSARFTLGEQRRTVEIAIPVRPGASAEEIERLLREADAGMAALTHHLDGRIADLIGQDGANGGNGAARSASPLPAAASSPAHPVAAPHDATPSTPSRPTPAAAAAPAPAHAAQSPAASTPPTPSATFVGAERSAAGSRPLPPRPTSTGAPATPPARPGAPHPAAVSTEPLTRPEFLAETRTLGLTPPQVMQRLQVRSLDGLNYREALDLLRRQLLDESGAAPTVAPAVPPPAATSMPTRAAAPASASAPAPAPAYFDEEDDYDITLTLPDDASASDDGYGDEMGGDMADDMDGEADVALEGTDDLYDVDDIPDIADVAEPPAAPPMPSAAGPARAHELLERFRGTTPGGAGTPDQIKAYTNLIVGQLDATQAGTLVRGIWGVAPNRLGFDQLYALIQWGKDDAFAEEAPAVLAVLKAEAAGKAAPAATAASQSAPPPRTTRTARGARASGGAGGDA